MKRILSTFVLGVAVCLGLTTAANAGNIQVDYNGQIGAGGVSFYLDGDNLGKRSTSAGLFKFHEDSNTSGLDILGTDYIYGFCIQLEQTISGDNLDFNIGDLADGRIPDIDGRGTLGADRANRIDQLFTLAFASTSGIINPAASSTLLQAVQIAIWEIAYESGTGTLNLGSGTIHFTDNSSAINYVNNQGWLTTINNAVNYQPQLSLWSMNSRTKQDFVVQSETGGDVGEVPEPGTMALSGIALVGLALLRRRAARS